ncbi:MAG: SDR family NAD(P)-dependent oxidoreductase [Planctomycetaceae bacterium]
MRLLFFPLLWYDRGRLRALLSGRTVCITGASFGIGESLALLLADSGARLILIARTADKLEQVQQQVRQRGGQAEIFPCDLSDSVAVQRLLQQLSELPCGVDILVSNAGRSIRRSYFESVDRFHDFTRTASLNYLTPVQLVLGLTPQLLAVRGQVINISAINVLLIPPPKWSAYQASKVAFDHWFRSVGPELNSRGVTTTSIYLPLVRTRMIQPTAHYDRYPAMQPEQVARLICRAILSRRRSYKPWWMPVAEVTCLVMRLPIEILMTLFLRWERRG